MHCRASGSVEMCKGLHCHKLWDAYSTGEQAGLLQAGLLDSSAPALVLLRPLSAGGDERPGAPIPLQATHAAHLIPLPNPAPLCLPSPACPAPPRPACLPCRRDPAAAFPHTLMLLGSPALARDASVAE